MRQLRFVRLSEDGTQLVLHSPDGVEHFGVSLDRSLREAVAGARATQPPTSAAPAVEQTAQPAAEPAPISPREIQMRVRAGESPEQVAQALGASLERIMRFAAAVVDERRRITEEARRSRARQTVALDGVDGKIVPFGEAVNARFAAHGISAAEIGWDSHRREDGEWVVIARWVGGAGEHEAHWVFNRAARMVTPADESAADLLNDRPVRPVRPSAPRLVVAPPLAPGVVAFPPMPDAHTGPIAVVEEEVFDQEAQSPQPAPKPLRPTFEREPRRTPRQTRPHVDPPVDDAGPDFDAPPLPLASDDTAETQPPTTPTTNRSTAPTSRSATASGTRSSTASGTRSSAKRERADQGRAARPRVPSWDDIVLGVRRNSD